jgi:GT2 family glycosyltransferase
MKLSCIIVNYNTRELLKDCIENLLQVKKEIPETEIIVVDNISTDNSVEMVEKTFGDKVTLVRNPENKLPAGHNLGFKASKGDYIMHVGTDAYPTAFALKKLMEYMDNHKDVGISTAKIVLRDGSLDMDAHRGVSTPWSSLMHWTYMDRLFPKSKLTNGYFLGYKDFSKPHEIDVCISHFMLVQREAYEKTGLWDETYFMYGEDLDFCYRMQEAGYKIMYIPTVEVLHFKGAGVGRKTTADLNNKSRRDKKHLAKVRTATIAAMKLFYKKHMEKKYPAPVNWLVYFGIYCLETFRKVMFKLRGNIY